MPLLETAGVLSVLDGGVLAAYCAAWDDFATCTEIIAREGRTVSTGQGGVKHHPAVGQQRSAMQALRLFGAQLGLSPEGRLRIRMSDGKVQTDEFAEFLSTAEPESQPTEEKTP